MWLVSPKFKASLVKSATQPLDLEVLLWHLTRADERNAAKPSMHHYVEVSDSRAEGGRSPDGFH